MRLPNYDECSLQELHKFIADRHIPFRFTRAQAHTKTQYKRDKEERRRLTAALDKADAAATIRFTDLPSELRDEIYGYHLTEITAAELLTTAELRERMSCVSPQFWEEARDVLNRGEYNILPELALDDSHESSTTPQLYRVLRSFSRQNSISLRANRSSRSYIAFNPQEAFDHLSEILFGKSPRQKLEESLEDCFAKIISMHDGVSDVVGLIPTTNSSEQTLKSYMKHHRL